MVAGTEPGPEKKSPYVSLYLARSQMAAIRTALAGGTPRKRDLDAALRHIKKALDDEE